MGDLKGSPHHLSNYENRLNTFLSWPSSAPIGRESLARAGFFYVGLNALVECFMCHVKCDHWSFGDTAIRKHQELSPNCPFVRENTDVLTDGTSIIVDPPMLTPNPIPTSNMQCTQADHGRGPPPGSNKLNAGPAPEFHKLWPNHDSMNKESERTKTFVGWPVTFIRPEDMARAGFVYLKLGDRVQCVFCYGIVAEWEVNDNPFQDHIKHFPRCPFVRGEKCNNISIEDELRGVQSRPLVPVSLRGVDECGHSSNRPNMESFDLERPADWFTRRQPPEPALEQLNVVAHQPSKHPNYATREARKESFKDWPSNIPQDVAALVAAGFYYTGMTDSVKCFQCGGGLKNWEPTDTPWEEHARWFPDCQYVALNKGREYVTLSKKNKPPILQNTSEQAPVDEISTPNGENTRTISESELEVLMNQDIVRDVLALGLDRDKVKKALEIRMREAGYPFPDNQSLAEAVLELPDHPLDVPKSSGNTSTTQEVETNPSTSIEINLENSPKTTKMNTNGRNLPGTREEDVRLCKVCMDREMNVVFLPCGHFVACVDCASVMDNCPMCRKKIKGHVKTYWP